MGLFSMKHRLLRLDKDEGLDQEKEGIVGLSWECNGDVQATTSFVRCVIVSGLDCILKGEHHGYL